VQPAPATIHVFTYKDGLLARLAHDLRFSLRRFEIVRDGDTVRGRFWPDALHVDGSVRHGQVDLDSFSAGDAAKIRRNLADDVLHTARHPEVTFEGELQGDGADGRLTMAGRTCPVRTVFKRQGDRLRAEITLTPSDWGIPPYKALAGAIKLQDRVVVALDLPADPTGAGSSTPESCTWTGPEGS
jgi:hypothetical protein